MSQHMNPRKKFKPRNSSSNVENELPNLFRPIVPHSEQHFYLKNSPNSKHQPKQSPKQQQGSPKQGSPNTKQPSPNTKLSPKQASPNKLAKNRSPKQSPQEYRKVQRKPVLVDNTSPVKRQLNYTDRKSPVNKGNRTSPTQQAKRLKCPAKTPDQLLSTSPSFSDFASPKSFMSPNAAEVPLPPTTWISTNNCSKQLMDRSNISAQLKELLNVA